MEKERLAEHKQQVAHLASKAKRIVRLKPRSPEEKSSSHVIVQALCDVQQAQVYIHTHTHTHKHTNTHTHTHTQTHTVTHTHTPVGSPDDEDVFLVAHAVHLGQDLVDDTVSRTPRITGPSPSGRSS